MVTQITEKMQDFKDNHPCICFNVRKAARAVTQVYEDIFSNIGITVTQVCMLNFCRVLGPLTVSQMAEVMATDRTTVTRNLKPLERDGLLKIEAGVDKRVKKIILSQKGEELLHKALNVWEKFQDKIKEDIGEDYINSVFRDLSDITQKIKGIKK